jgi:putative peptidoglycan lipid II flippase
MIALLRNGLNRISNWQRESVNRRIFAAMAAVACLTVFVKAVSAVKDVVVAYHFGTGDALDAFLVAFVIPAFTINVIAGSFAPSVVPTYIRVRAREGQEAAGDLLSGAMTWVLAMLILVASLLWLAGGHLLAIVGSGFSAEKLALARELFVALLPAIVLSGVSAMAGAILNAGERFAPAAFAPACIPLAVILVLSLRGPMSGIHSLVMGTLVGYVFEAAILLWQLKRRKMLPALRLREPNGLMKDVTRQYVPMVAGACLMSSTELVGQTMAAMLEPGSVSALSYGNKVVAFGLGIGSLAIGTAVLPHFSRLVANGEWRSLRHTLMTYARLIVLFAVPITLAVVYFSVPIVRLLFERGAFDASATQVVARVQALYCLQVPFYLVGILLVRLVSALQANQVLMWGAVISLVLNVVLNYAFMKWLGVAGIALSTSVVYVVSVCYLGYMVAQLHKRHSHA